MIREATEKDKKSFDKKAAHPLQSWEWGEFRKQTGVEITRLIQKGPGINRVFQITWHKIPKTKFCIGYCPKSLIPNLEATKAIAEIAKKKNALMVKFEPSERLSDQSTTKIRKLVEKGWWVGGKSLFTKFTFWLDLRKGEEELLKQMNQKTRYNVRLAEKRGVSVVEDNSDEAFEEYWKLTQETTKRQGFYAHTKKYHQLMWKQMRESGIAHLFKAVHDKKILTIWIVFVLNGVLYYPYGASSSEGREVMPSNLMMWEVIKFGRKMGCKLFDMWGSLGKEPDKNDNWYGFHKFKEGYGGDLVEFVGTFDMVVNPWGYKIYIGVDKVRWWFLRLIKKFS